LIDASLSCDTGALGPAPIRTGGCLARVGLDGHGGVTAGARPWLGRRSRYGRRRLRFLVRWWQNDREAEPGLELRTIDEDSRADPVAGDTFTAFGPQVEPALVVGGLTPDAEHLGRLLDRQHVLGLRPHGRLFYR
jgi:hypothetical protein